MQIKHLALACLFSLSVTASAQAQLRHVEMKTLGMDWETCAHAVRVAMQKVTGVTSVNVSLNAGLTVIDFAPENTVTLAGLRQIIRNNGFVTNESKIVARGSVRQSGGSVTFAVSGSNETIVLKAMPAAPAEFDRLRERVKTGAVDVVIEGTVDTKDPKAFVLSVAKTTMQ